MGSMLGFRGLAVWLLFGIVAQAASFEGQPALEISNARIVLNVRSRMPRF